MSNDEDWDFKLNESEIKKNVDKKSRPKRKIPKKSKKLKLEEHDHVTRRKKASLAKRNARLENYAEIKNAPLSSRVFAEIIDIVLVAVFYAPLIIFTDKVFRFITPYFYRYGFEQFVKVSTLRSMDYIFYFVVVYLFLIVLPSAIWKKSLGKKMMSLRVGHKFDDTPTTKGKVFLRELIKPISIASILGLLVIFINQDRRALHDFFFATKVYDEN